MKIKRWQYCNATEYYELDITDETLKEYKELLQKYAVNPEIVPDITYDMIKDAMNGDYAEEDNIVIHCKRTHYDGSPWEYDEYLYDWLRDIVNENVWDSYIEQVDSDSYDDETEIED